MNKICKNCQYFRDSGQMDADIPGTGHWCSNSQSGQFRMRVAEEGGCVQFSARGRKAPLAMRVTNKGLGWVNKKLRKK